MAGRTSPGFFYAFWVAIALGELYLYGQNQGRVPDDTQTYFVLDGARASACPYRDALARVAGYTRLGLVVQANICQPQSGAGARAHGSSLPQSGGFGRWF